MTTPGETPDHLGRLNPLNLPSDTDLRFALLILAVLAASTFAYTWLYNMPWVGGREYVAAMKHCAGEMAKAKPGGEALKRDPVAYVLTMAEVAKQFGQCLAFAERAKGYSISACLAVLLVLSALIYLAMPRWKIWRRRLQVLSAADDPKLFDDLTRLTSECGLQRPPTFLLDLPDRSPTGAVAFGHLGQKYVKLSAGLTTRFYTDPPAFRAVVLHELAHLRNADVDKSWFTVALLLGFAMLVLLPLAGGFLYFFYDFSLSWRVLVLAALVIVAGIGVVRAREFYADARVGEWDGPAPLSGVLKDLPTVKGWRRLLDFHPDPSARIQAIADPPSHPLFEMHFWEAFATGLAAMTIYLNAFLFVGSFLTGTALVGQQPMLTAAIFLPVALGIVGLGVWRSVAEPRARSRLGRLAVGLALGLIVGEKVAFQPTIMSKSALLSPYGLLWSSALVAAVYLCLRWVGSGASVWLETDLGRKRFPRRIGMLGVALAGLALAGFFGGALTLRLTVSGAGSVGDALLSFAGVLYPFLISPLTGIAILAAWAYPLAAWFRGARSVPVSSRSGRFWGRSDRMAIEPPARAPLDPKKAIAMGIAGGVGFTLVLLVTRLGLLRGLSEETLDSPAFLQAFSLARIGFAILVAAVVAALVARRVRALPILHGLAAAYVSGCIATAGWLGSAFLFYGSEADVDWSFAWWVFTHVVNGGAVVALPVAFLAQLGTRVTPEGAALI